MSGYEGISVGVRWYLCGGARVFVLGARVLVPGYHRGTKSLAWNYECGKIGFLKLPVTSLITL